MRYGPAELFACPSCGRLAKRRVLWSGNTFGQLIWSDGYRDAPMLPILAPISVCRGCGRACWVNAVEAVATVDDPRYRREPEWRAAEFVREPTEAEYYMALAQGLAADRDAEIELRVHAWWLRNHPARLRPVWPWQRWPDLPARDPEPLSALFGLLSDEVENELWYKAELHRQAGEFDEAQALLARLTSPESAWFRGPLAALCDKRERGLRCLRGPAR